MVTWIESLLYWVGQRCLFWICGNLKKGPQHVTVIYKPDAIGDLLLASGAIKLLMENSTDQHVLICSERSEHLAKYLFPNLRTISLKEARQTDKFKLCNKIFEILKFSRKYHTDNLISLRHSLTGIDHVILNSMRADYSVGISNSPIQGESPSSFKKYCFTEQIDYPKKRGSFPLEIQAHLNVCSSYLKTTLSEKDIKPFLDLKCSETPIKPVLSVFPVTFSKLRNYPLQKLADSINDFLSSRQEYCLVISGTKSDYNQLLTFQNLIIPSVQNEIVLPHTIIDAALMIRNSSIILSMDSAPAHISIILDRPGVYLLAGGQFDHFAPWGTESKHRWLYQKVPCYHCNWKCVFNQPKCIIEIPSDLITKNLKELAVNNYLFSKK